MVAAHHARISAWEHLASSFQHDRTLVRRPDRRTRDGNAAGFSRSMRPPPWRSGLAQILLKRGNDSLAWRVWGGIRVSFVAFATMFPEAQIVALLFFVIPLKFRAKYLGWGLAGSSFLFLLVRIRAMDCTCGASWWMRGRTIFLRGLTAMGFRRPPERLLKKWLSSRAI